MKNFFVSPNGNGIGTEASPCSFGKARELNQNMSGEFGGGSAGGATRQGIIRRDAPEKNSAHRAETKVWAGKPWSLRKSGTSHFPLNQSGNCRTVAGEKSIYADD